MQSVSAKDNFYHKILKLVIPIIIQNLLSAAVSSADVVMLNYVGQSSISAVSLAANYASVLFMIYYGLGTGASMLSAQYWGKGDLQPIRAVQGIAMRFSLVISLGFSGFAFFAPELMMKLFTNDTELITIGAGYLRVMAVTYLCWGIIEVYLAILRSIGRVTVCMVLNVMAFTLNIFLNAVFIFGLFGAPQLGATGVAIATALSRIIELIGCIVVSMFSKDIKLKSSYMFLRNRLLFQDFVRLSLPALGNDIAWSIAFSMYSVILGHMGSDAVAANSLVIVVRNFGTVLCFGTASAGGILLGNVMGEGNMEHAKSYASKLMKLTVIMGAAVNTTLIAGVFRAGGDSRFGLICDVIDMWVYAVPLGFLAAFVFKLPVLWVYFLLCTDEFVKWPWVIRHYRSGKWLKNITREDLFAAETAAKSSGGA